MARRPPGNVVAAVPLSVIDRLRDLVDAVAVHEPGDGAPRLRRLSTVLGGLAHRLEHLPVMRRGEDPSTARRSGVVPFERGRAGRGD